MKSIRVYADTSVFGGVFDDEFSKAISTFFEDVKRDRFQLVVSKLVIEELADAPPPVRDLFRQMHEHAEVTETTDEALELVQAYLNAGIVTDKWRDDALHVAVATASECRVIVSWNFRHIVHFRKIPLYNGISVAKGYAPVAIHTPREVLEYEDKDL